MNASFALNPSAFDSDRDALAATIAMFLPPDHSPAWAEFAKSTPPQIAAGDAMPAAAPPTTQERIP
jgi:hypothetical protein